MDRADYMVIVDGFRDSLDPSTKFTSCPRCRQALGPGQVISRRYLAATLQSIYTQCPCHATVEILPGSNQAAPWEVSDEEP
jgi:RNase P subunit RPR2